MNNNENELYIAKYYVDVFTENTVESKFPEDTYPCQTMEEISDVIKGCSRKISGIVKVEVWINEHDEEN